MHVLQNTHYWRSNLEIFLPSQPICLEINSQLYAQITTGLIILYLYVAYLYLLVIYT